MAAEAIAQITAELNDIGVDFTIHKHEAVMTCAEHKAAAGHLPGVLTKNMLVKDKAKKLFLIVTSDKKNRSK